MGKIDKKLIIAAVIGFVVGLIWFVAVRYITYQSADIHYHANFALYVDGERDHFDSFTFYEEVQACEGAGEVNPKNRVHMHNNENHVVHVHDGAATWGHFFANLGYGLTNRSLQTDTAVFVDGEDGNRLTFMLNGESVDFIANRVIGDEDVLLVNYGDENEQVLIQRLDDIPRDAGEYNGRKDPGGCGGEEHSDPWTRLKRAIGIGTNGR